MLKKKISKPTKPPITFRIKVNKRPTIWNELYLPRGAIYGFSSNGLFFAYDHRITKKSILLYIANASFAWQLRSISYNHSLSNELLILSQQYYEYCDEKILIGKSKVRKKKELLKYGVPIIDESLTPEEQYVLVDTPEEYNALCKISLLRIKKNGFVLQRGHIFGRLDNMLFVTSVEHRKSDGAIAVHYTYDYENWLKGWFFPDETIYKIALLANEKRLELGITRLEFSERHKSSNEENNFFDKVYYAKQEYLQTNEYSQVTSGGLVSPK